MGEGKVDWYPLLVQAWMTTWIHEALSWRYSNRLTCMSQPSSEEACHQPHSVENNDENLRKHSALCLQKLVMCWSVVAKHPDMWMMQSSPLQFTEYREWADCYHESDATSNEPQRESDSGLLAAQGWKFYIVQWSSMLHVPRKLEASTRLSSSIHMYTVWVL